MTTADSIFRNGASELTLKTTPRLVWPRFKLQFITMASQMCTDITGLTGLLAWVLTVAQWAALPGHSVVNAAGVVIVEPIFDILMPIVQPAAGAAAATVKYYEMSRNDRSEIKKGLSVLKTYLINHSPDSDISELGDINHGLMYVNLQQIFAHEERKYGTLNSDDFHAIYDTLEAVKLPTTDFSDLAEIHRNMHRLLTGSGQPCAEYDKTEYYIKAIRDDPQGHEAASIFVRLHLLVADRNFADLIETILLHAPTITPSTSTLGYANALSTATVSSALAAAPTEVSALKQQIAKLQKQLSATDNRTKRAHGPTPAKSGALHYCWAHGYQYSHLGSACKVMLNDKKYTAQQKAATDPLTPAGGNTATKG